jgi:hypothetical protein
MLPSTENAAMGMLEHCCDLLNNASRKFYSQTFKTLNAQLSPNKQEQGH